MKTIDFEAFKELIQQCSRVTEKFNAEDVQTVRNYEDVLSEIASIFGSEHKTALRNLDRLLSELAIKSVADGEALEFVYETIRVLMDALRQSTVGQPGVDDPWRSAITLIMDNQHLFIAHITPERNCPARYMAVGQHVKTLRDMGYAVEIVNGTPDVSPEEITKVNAEVDRLCKELGGPTLVYNILRFISDVYDSMQQRYPKSEHL